MTGNYKHVWIGHWYHIHASYTLINLSIKRSAKIHQSRELDKNAYFQVALSFFLKEKVLQGSKYKQRKSEKVDIGIPGGLPYKSDRGDNRKFRHEEIPNFKNLKHRGTLKIDLCL